MSTETRVRKTYAPTVGRIGYFTNTVQLLFSLS